MHQGRDPVLDRRAKWRTMPIFPHPEGPLVTAFFEDTPRRHVAEEIIVVAAHPRRIPAVSLFTLQRIIHHRLAGESDEGELFSKSPDLHRIAERPGRPLAAFVLTNEMFELPPVHPVQIRNPPFQLRERQAGLEIQHRLAHRDAERP